VDFKVFLGKEDLDDHKNIIPENRFQYATVFDNIKAVGTINKTLT